MQNNQRSLAVFLSGIALSMGTAIQSGCVSANELDGQVAADANPGSTEQCADLASGVVGAHIVADVSWPATTGVVAGTGQVHIWTLSNHTYKDGNLSGTVRPCGSVVPPLEGSSLVGGGMIQTVIPDEVWDSSSIPTATATGVISGFHVGSTINLDPVTSLIGATMADSQGPWPQTGAELAAVDHDRSGKPGITSNPRGDNGFRLPPLDLVGAISPNGARGDVLYLATRNIIELDGTRDSCETARGTATFHAFDNHVIGCHVKDGGECNSRQAGFVDMNRTVFQVSTASFQMKLLDAGATCATVRAALPE